ncbi:MAG: hemerythrin domain-containing protein [Sphingomonas sp.]|uniref:hemerythrin domain-containing protein n=1 Tax=Sphingomonas sp. TaxID=28214 RepID=UPI00120EFB71|nr:hemerythrin domain-containing protein [Sphingomonas sp.]THD36823.1 MAG: hemerythrin domain-containing protein [Sphingomonas sp.]
MAAAEQKERSSSKAGKVPSASLGMIAGVGAAGAALGVLAMIGRKFAVQAPTYFAGDWDDALAAEHKATLLVFDAIQATPDSAKVKRSMLLANLKHMLAKHALEEENAIYPALRDAGMVAEADELNSEHGYVKQYLYELDNMPNDTPKFLETMAKFRADIEHHMREEEDGLFPRLKAQLDEERNRTLTRAMNKEGFKIA